MKKTINKSQMPTRVNDTLDAFLFKQIQNNTDYIAWQQNFEMPSEIDKNLSKKLRPYQTDAIKAFIYHYENNGMEKCKHLLFNMATGTGKTLVMAAIVLYLHEQGYSNFVFLVHQLQIKDQAVKNFTDPKFDKYLFTKTVKFNGKNIKIRQVSHFENANNDDINFMFCSTSMLYQRLTVLKENSLSLDDFVRNKTVIIADEAHRLNVDTKKKLNKTEQQDAQNWEGAVQLALNANDKNMLLEFTATVDFKNPAIFKKYQDKLITKYDFLQFNKDGYSKNVQFLFNQETHIEDQKRLLIVNAVVLSEYRKLFAKYQMNMDIAPVVLIKSTKISQSKDDRDFFHNVIGSLKIDDFRYLQDIGKGQSELFDKKSIIDNLFKWLKYNFATQKDPTGLLFLIGRIKQSFAEQHTMIYNSEHKQNADKLLTLDTPNNTMRAIFSVDALNEGWDVLGLYDIIHFDISASKKVSLQDIQLIGRGARLKPYKLSKNYPIMQDGVTLSYDEFKRKFDNAPDDNGRILESFYYHFVKTGVFYDQLKQELLGEGIIDNPKIKRTIYLKDSFIKSDTYKTGFVLANTQKIRQKTEQSLIDETFNCTIKATSYQLYNQTLSDKDNNKRLASQRVDTITLSENYFSRAIIDKALMRAEYGFFRFENITKHIVGLDSIDTLIDKYLPKCQIEYTYDFDKNINRLSPKEKLQLLVNMILPKLRQNIDKNMPQVVGDTLFRPYALSDIFKTQKHIYLVAGDNGAPIDERGIAQSTHDNSELCFDVQSSDWYAYSENYGTSEEKKFVKFIANYIDQLKQKYPTAEIYLIRNELDYYLFNIDDGRRFSPDYLLIINDKGNVYYQCLFEPKGTHLLAFDEYKQKALLNIETLSQIDAKDYEANFDDIKLLGFKFFNSDDCHLKEFRADFEQKLGF